MTIDLDELQTRFSQLKYSEQIWVDANPRAEEFEDDGFIHISRGHLRFVFFNGQGKGILKDTEPFKKKIDALLKRC